MNGPHTNTGSGGGKRNSVDFAGGDGKVRAAASGTVKSTSCGVLIDHGGGWHTSYYHLTGITVSANQKVSVGDHIGNIGNAVPCGGYSTAAHVHFAVWKFSGTYSGSDAQAVAIDCLSIGGWTVGGDGRIRSDHDGQCLATGGGATVNGSALQLQSCGASGVSDDTVRRWVDGGRLHAVADEAGRQAIDGVELAALAQELADKALDQLDGGTGSRSARNHLTGLITRVVSDTVMSQVELQCGRYRIVSLISTEAVQELGLEPGVVATAVIKATNVTIEMNRA